MDTGLALDKQLSIDRLLKWRKVRVLQSRGNPNIDITSVTVLLSWQNKP